MWTEVVGCVPHLKMAATRFFRVCVYVLRMSMLGASFRRPDRFLPPAVHIRGIGFCFTSLLFLAAAVLRDVVCGGKPLKAVLVFQVVFYFVMLMVSTPKWISEFTLYLCVSMGISLVAACLMLTGVMELGDGAVQTWLYFWQLAAVFVALVQLRLGRLPAAAS